MGRTVLVVGKCVKGKWTFKLSLGKYLESRSATTLVSQQVCVSSRRST